MKPCFLDVSRRIQLKKKSGKSRKIPTLIIIGYHGIGIPTAGFRDPEHFSIPIPNPDPGNLRNPDPEANPVRDRD
jgi:hypothetical protein